MANNKKNDPMSGIAYLKKQDNENPKAPLIKGFISITPELAKVLSNMEPDGYGTVKLEVALWANAEQPGVLKGTAQLPYAVRQGKTEEKKKPVVNEDNLEF